MSGKVNGDSGLEISHARVLLDAKIGDITFLDNAKHASRLESTHASAAVVPPNTPRAGMTTIEVADPLPAFTAIVQHFQAKAAARPTGIHPRALVDASAVIGAEPSIAGTAVIDENAIIGARCKLGPGVVVGKNCKLGDDVTLHANVVLYDDTVLGDRVSIHANAAIGADGFGYRFQQGRHVKVLQLGNVVIGNDVEIGAGATIDRATFGSTRIGDGTKIDNLVQIGHNCQIGKHNILAGQVGIGGSCTTGSYVMMGGQAGVKDHINIGDRVMLGAKTGVIHDIPAGKGMFLYPAFEERDAARLIACLKRLPQMRRDLLRVLKELGLAEAEEPNSAIRAA